MQPSDINYWRDTIRICEMAMKERSEKWRRLKRRLLLNFAVDGVKEPIYISRFYKILRETIASIAFRHPYVYVKAEEDPADPAGGEVLENAGPILQDFANDVLEIMNLKPKVKQVIFDACFCFRGWLKFAFNPPSGLLAPYIGSDNQYPDFPCVTWARPEHVLTDPLVQPDDFYTSRFVIHKMFPSLSDLISDPRFKDFETQLRGLKHQTAGASRLPFDPYESEYERSADEGKTQEVLKETHRLADTRCAYEIQDRIKQREYFFVDGIEAPIGDRDHPFLSAPLEKIQTATDPMTGKPLLSRVREFIAGAEDEGHNPKERRKYIVKGGLSFLSFAFDVADEFYGPALLEYENPIQDAIIKLVSRQMLLQDRFKRHPVIKKQELEDNPNIRTVLKDGEDGEPIPLNDIDAIRPEISWGNPPPGADRLEQSLLAYEADTIRTTASAVNPDTATETAVAASETEINRLYSQDPVEEIYTHIITNTFMVLSDERFTPKNQLLRIGSSEGAEVTRKALRAWMLQGRWNVNMAAGSSNILYEAMNKDKAAWVVDRLRNSPNVDQLKLDKYIIRAGGEMEPSGLLKKDANLDAAKAAELENQMMMMHQHDPGVTPGEDHRTHMAFQHPNIIAQHPQFSTLPPELQQYVARIAVQHFQAHQQAFGQEAGGVPERTGGNGKIFAVGTPDSLIRQVQSAAQTTQDVVSKEAEQRMGRG